MKDPVALLARILAATSLTICLAMPAGAQRGGSGGSHGAGGVGSHGGGVYMGGGHVGGGGHAVGVGAGFVRGGGRMAAPAMRAPIASIPAPAVASPHIVSTGSAPVAWSQHIYTPADAAAARTRFAGGNIVWQEPPAMHPAVYPTRVGVPANAWRSPDPNRPPVTSSRFVRMPSPTLGRMRTPPRALLTPPPLVAPVRPRLFPPPLFGVPAVPSRTFGPGFLGCVGDFDCDGDFDGFFPNRFFFSNGFSCFCGFGFSPWWFSPFGFWPGWGWGWDSGPGTFGYGTGNYANSMTQPSDYSTPSTESGPFTYQNPPEESQQPNVAATPAPLTILFFKDGSSYGVTDYWLVNGRLHYITSYGGENEIDFDQLDLQRTVDENDRRGVPFVLRSAENPRAQSSEPDTPSPPQPSL